MRFHDGRTFMIEVGRKRDIEDMETGAVDFGFLWTRERKVVAQCVRRNCRCDQCVQELSLIEFRETSECLIWDDGKVPLGGHQEFRLRKDGGHLYPRRSGTWNCSRRGRPTKRPNRPNACGSGQGERWSRTNKLLINKIVRMYKNISSIHNIFSFRYIY